MSAAKNQYRLTIANSLSDVRQRIVNCATLTDAEGLARDWAENSNPSREDDSDGPVIVTVSIEIDTSGPEDEVSDWLEVAEIKVEVLG